MTAMWRPARQMRPSLLLILLAGAPGCGLLFPEGPAPATLDPTDPVDSAPGEVIDPTGGLPEGTGSLRQDQVSISLRRGELQIRVTPLDESVTRVTAPDTYERLSALERGHQELFRERTGAAVPFKLFLVSLYTEATEVTFEPEAMNLVNRGLRYRPADILPVTPGWNTRILRPREVLMAVYAFPHNLDLERDLEVEYQEMRSRGWDRILPVIQGERSRLGIRTGPSPNP